MVKKTNAASLMSFYWTTLVSTRSCPLQPKDDDTTVVGGGDAGAAIELGVAYYDDPK